MFSKGQSVISRNHLQLVHQRTVIIHITIQNFSFGHLPGFKEEVLKLPRPWYCSYLLPKPPGGSFQNFILKTLQTLDEKRCRYCQISLQPLHHFVGNFVFFAQVTPRFEPNQNRCFQSDTVWCDVLTWDSKNVSPPAPIPNTHLLARMHAHTPPSLEVEKCHLGLVKQAHTLTLGPSILWSVNEPWNERRFEFTKPIWHFYSPAPPSLTPTRPTSSGHISNLGCGRVNFRCGGHGRESGDRCG